MGIEFYTGSDRNKVIGNNMSSNGSGIRLHGGCYNNTILNNNILNSFYYDGIELDDSHNCTVVGNHVTWCTDGIDETGAANGNVFTGNMCDFNSGDDYDINGANSIFGYNIGTRA